MARAKVLKCDCGHKQNVSDIHGVFDKHKYKTICESCFMRSETLVREGNFLILKKGIDGLRKEEDVKKASRREKTLSDY